MAEEFDVSKVRSISVDSLAVGSKIYLVLEDGTRIWAGGRITESQTTTEEKKVWDEKPEPVWVPRGYSSKSKIKEDDIPMLILEEMDAFYEKLKEHIDWQQSYIDANQLIVNQFAFHDEIYWWKGMNLNEMQEQLEAARERVRNGLLQADAPLWFLRSLQRDLGVSEE